MSIYQKTRIPICLLSDRTYISYFAKKKLPARGVPKLYFFAKLVTLKFRRFIYDLKKISVLVLTNVLL